MFVDVAQSGSSVCRNGDSIASSLVRASASVVVEKITFHEDGSHEMAEGDAVETRPSLQYNSSSHVSK